MDIGGVPLALQSIVTLYPQRTYAGLPIVTLLFPSVIVSGLVIFGPTLISGGSPKRKEGYIIISLSNYTDSNCVL